MNGVDQKRLKVLFLFVFNWLKSGNLTTKTDLAGQYFFLGQPKGQRPLNVDGSTL